MVSGTLTAAAGSTGVIVTGSGSNSITLIGSVAKIDSFLAEPRRDARATLSSDTPPASDTLTLKVNDGGNTGTGGAKTGSDTAIVNIGAVNDAPGVALPSTQNTPINTPLVLSRGNGNAITVSDVDAGAASLRVTLLGTNGKSHAGQYDRADAAWPGNGTSNVVFTGTLTDINNALNGLVVHPEHQLLRDCQLQVAVDDQGNTGVRRARS